MAGGDKVAGIVFGADTTQLKGAADDLKNLKTEAQGAAAAADKAGDAISGAGKKSGGSWEKPGFELKKVNKELSETERLAAKAGISVGQFSNGMRMLPAQFTDVVTQLAGGQNPFLIMIQQGGQIKDSFGGLQGMFTALRSTISPTTVALTTMAAVLGGLAYSVNSVTSSFDAANKAIIQTSGYAYQSASQIAEAAAGIANETGLSVRSVMDTMSSLTSTGKLTREEIEKVAGAVARWKEIDEDTAASIEKNAARITDKPLSALADLNKQYHFLTDAQAQQIVALQRAGKEAEAASLGLDIYSQAMDRMAKAQYDSLPGWQKAWIDFKNAASNAARDVAIDFSTAGTLVQQSFAVILNGLGGMVSKADVILQEWLVSIVGKLAKIPGTNGFFGPMLKDASDQLKKSQADFQRYTDAGAKNIDFLNKKWSDQRKEIEKGFSPQSPIVAPKDSDKATKTLEEGQKKVTKQKQAQADAGDRLVDQANAETLELQTQLKYLREHRDVDEKISQQRQKLWKDQAMFQVLEEKARTTSLTKAEQQKLATKEQVLAQDEINAKLGDQITAQTRVNDLIARGLKFTEQSQAKLTEINAKYSGQTDREAERAMTLQRLSDQFAGDKGTQSRVVAQQQALYDAEDEGRSNWIEGVKKSFNEYAEAGSNAFQIAQDGASQAFSSMNDFLLDFITTGKASFSDFTKSILQMLAQIALKLAETMAIKAAMSALGYATGGYTGDGGKYEPAGVVHKGEFVMTKEATSRIGVANLYRMMRGYATGGLVGGSGPSMAGGSGGNSIQVSTTVNVGNGGGPVDPAQTSQYQKDMQSVIDESVQKGIDRAMKPGGRLYKYQSRR